MLKYDIAPKTTYTWKALNQIDQFLFRNFVWFWYWSGIGIGIYIASFLIVLYLIVFSNVGLILLLLLITSRALVWLCFQIMKIMHICICGFEI